MIMFYFSDRAYGFWWDTILIHEKGVFKFVKEQQILGVSRVNSQPPQVDQVVKQSLR